MKSKHHKLKGCYFLTLTTKDQKNYFGKIQNDRVILNRRGEIANLDWTCITRKFSNVSLDEYVVMPNHIHAIVIFKDNSGRKRREERLLSEILDAFESCVENDINRSFPRAKKFRWQKTPEIRPISSETELFDMRYYIDSNPIRWDMDPENLSRGQKITVRSR
jgi:REP element-mobilizing transposase RayT